MAQKKPPRLLINPDHLDVAKGLLQEAEIGRLIIALSDYFREGKQPEGQSNAWNVCFNLLRGDIDDNARRYDERCEKNRQNIKKRWEQQKTSSDADRFVQPNTIVFDRIRPNTNHTNIKEDKIKEDKIKEEEPFFGGLSSQIVDYQRADDFIRRYRLPDSDTSREALLEDAENVGFDRLEDALKQASLSNSRPLLSVTFYRKFLADNGQKRGDSFADFGYERF